MYEPHPMPSLEEIEQMERQRSQALDAIEIFDHTVKCQKCGNAVPVVGKPIRTKNDKLVKLQTRQRFMENHPHFCSKEDLEAVKQELAELLKEDAKEDKLRTYDVRAD
jgi:adenine-specific DNA methylase